MERLSFDTNSLFELVRYDVDSDSWYFSFKDNVGVNSSCVWRLLQNGKIIWVSLDHGYQFGLPKPVDLVDELTKLLTSRNLVAAIIDDNTGDLILKVSGGIEIQILISSSGYETYHFTIGKKNYIGTGSGELAIYETP